DAGEHEYILKNRDHAGGEHFVQRIHVGGDARHQPAYRIFIEEPDVHLLQVSEDLAAQIEHDHLSSPLHQVRLHKFQNKIEEQGSEIDQRNLPHADPGV